MKVDLTRDWYGKPLLNPLYASLNLTSTHLIFEIRFALKTSEHPLSKKGIYQPELWKHDVAELFISNPSEENQRYLEINLNPTGAWWMMAFDQVRQPNSDFAPPQMPSPVSVSRTDKSCEIHLERTFLETHLQAPLPACNVNTTVISNTAESSQFASLAELPGKEPDFHQPQNHLPLSDFL